MVNNKMILMIVFSIILNKYCLCFADRDITINLENSQFDAVSIGQDSNSIYLGINRYKKTGHFDGESKIRKISSDSLGKILWEKKLKYKIIEIEELEGFLTVDCFSGPKMGLKTYFLKAQNGKLIDSLTQKMYTIQNDVPMLYYTDRYRISGGHYKKNIDTKVYRRRIGEKKKDTIDFNGLIYSLYATSNKLLVLAISKEGKGKLSLWQLDPDDTNNIFSPIELLEVDLDYGMPIRFIDSSTFIIGSIFYKINHNRIKQYKAVETPRNKTNINKNYKFLFYSHGRIYYKTKKELKYFYTMFDEQFDDLSEMIEACNMKICLNKSFLLCNRNTIVYATIKKRNTTLKIVKKKWEE